MPTTLQTVAIMLYALPSLALAVPIDDFEGDGPAWICTLGPEFPGAEGSFEVAAGASAAGDACGRLNFDFTGGGAYVQATIALPTDPALQAVELMVRKAVGNQLTVRVVDQTDQTFQKSFNFAAQDWQRVRVKLDTGTSHWGGAGDGVMHGAPKALGILVERAPVSVGFIEIDDVVGIVSEEGGAMERYTPEYTVVDFADPGTALRYDFADDADGPRIGTDISLLGNPQALRLSVVSDGSGHEVYVTLHSHFQSFKRAVGGLDDEGEMVFTAPLSSMDSWSHFGGEDDGIIRPPLRFGSVSLERGEGGPETGAILLRKLSVVTEVAEDAALFPLAASGETDAGPVFELAITSLAPEPVSAEVLCTQRDFNGRVVDQQTRQIEIQPVSESEALQVAAAEAAADFSEMEFSVTAAGQRPRSAVATFTAPLPSASDSPRASLDPTSPFGMGLYLYRYSDTPDGLAQMDRAAQMAQNAGIKWSREEFLWHRIEPEEGRFDWDYYDTVVETATDHGISIYGLIDYWSEWTDAYTQQGVEDYVRYCRALVEHYKDRIKHWEIWNEPNIFFWSGDKELYFDLLDQAYAAIKETDPEAIVFGCSTAGIDTSFIQRTLDAGARFDGLTIHPYRGSLDDMAFVEELRSTQELVGGRPVWITEMGWPTHVNGGVSEREQAALLARTYIDAVASGACGNVSWYDFREDGSNPYYNEHHFGIVSSDFRQKPAYRAAGVVCNALAGLKCDSVERTEAGLVVCRFVGEGRGVIAVWPTEGTQLVSIQADPEDFRVCDLMGQDQPCMTVGVEQVVAVQPSEPVLIFSGESAIPVRVSDVSIKITPPYVRPGSQVTITCVGGDAAQEEVRLDAANPPAGWTVYDDRGGRGLAVGVPEDVAPGDYSLGVTLGSGDASLVAPVRIEVVAETIDV